MAYAGIVAAALLHLAACMNTRATDGRLMENEDDLDVYRYVVCVRTVPSISRM